MYKKNQSILTEVLDGEGAILLDENTEMVYVLNEIGYYIWENIECNTIESLADRIYKNASNKNEYTLKKIHDYVLEYINTLVNKGLVV